MFWNKIHVILYYNSRFQYTYSVQCIGWKFSTKKVYGQTYSYNKTVRILNWYPKSRLWIRPFVIFKWKARIYIHRIKGLKVLRNANLGLRVDIMMTRTIWDKKSSTIMKSEIKLSFLFTNWYKNIMKRRNTNKEIKFITKFD